MESKQEIRDRYKKISKAHGADLNRAHYYYQRWLEGELLKKSTKRSVIVSLFSYVGVIALLTLFKLWLYGGDISYYFGEGIVSTILKSFK